MITNNQVKIIRSLSTRKGRKTTGWFMAEGPKVVGDLQAAGFRPVAIYDEMEDVRRISQLQHPQGVVGIFEIPAGPRDGAGIDPCWNPKVIQATMGSIARVAIHYAPLVPLIDALDKDCPVYTTQLDGENIYETKLKPHGVIVMGNEGNGVTEEVRRRATRPLLIPNFPQGRTTAESLNVAIATALVLGEFRRRMF